MAIRITVNDDATPFFTRFVAWFAGGKVMPVLEQVAMQSLRRLIIATPKGFTGLTRKQWRIHRLQRGFLVTNTSKVMRFLELGTQAHGPVTKQFLYIPLNRKAAIGGGNASLKYGVDYVLAKRVRGIVAKRIVYHERTVVRGELNAAMRAYIVRSITSSST